MFKPTAVHQQSKTLKSLLQSETNHSGYLLITQQDEIIYANRQARHFLGLLTDEKIPFKQTFLSLVRSTYQCHPAGAWLSWPKQPSTTTTRYLIYTPPANDAFFQLKVEMLEQIIIDGLPIWAVSMVAIESQETAVAHSIISH